MRDYPRKAVVVCFTVLIALFAAQPARASFMIGGAASSYAVLYENGGNNTLQITNVTVNGNIGVGAPLGSAGQVTVSGPSTINGSIDFAPAYAGQFHNNNGSNVITGGENYSVAAVASALNSVNSLNSSLGAEAGTSVGIGTGSGQTLTIDAGSGMLDLSGNEVFDVASFNTTNSDILTIHGDAAHDSVVMNFIGLSANFNNQVVLDGLTSDQVLYNFVGGSNLSGGPALQINDNASASGSNEVQGVFLNPNGPISVVNANVVGRVFGGDSHDMQIVSGDTFRIGQQTQTPEPSSLGLLTVALLTLIGAGVFRQRRASTRMS